MPCRSSRRCTSQSAIDINLLEAVEVPHTDSDYQSDVVRDVRHIRRGFDITYVLMLDKVYFLTRSVLRVDVHPQSLELAYPLLEAPWSQHLQGCSRTTLMTCQCPGVRCCLYAKARCWAKSVVYVVDELGV